MASLGRRTRRECGLRLCALCAGDGRANHGGPPIMRENPWSLLPGRIVSHVNSVAALEVSHPLLLFVRVKADDPSRRCVDRAHCAIAAYTFGVQRSR